MPNFASFGQQPVGTAGPTTGSIIKSVANAPKKGTFLLANLAGGIGQNSTVPFAGGGNASPNNLNAGLNLGKGIKSLGINAKSPNQNVTPPANTIPSNQVSSSQGNSGGGLGSYKGVQINPGTQAQIQAQMAAIDAKQSAPQTPQTPQTPAQNPQTANTYSGGVNAYGQTLPGYTPQSSGSTSGTTGTGTTGAGTSGTTGYGGTVPTTLSALFNAANNMKDINAVTAQEQKLLGDYASTPGLPDNIYQGRAGQVEQIGNSLIQNLLTARGQQIGAAQSALGAVAPITGCKGWG